MKQISIREFQLHAEQYLKELPLMLTRYNMPIAVIQNPNTIAVNGVVEFDEPSKMDKFKKLKEQIEGGHIDIGKKIAPDGFKVSTEEQEDEQFKKYIDEPQVIYSNDF